MKKYIFVTILIITVVSSFSQDGGKPKIRLSIIASPQLSWLKPDINLAENDGMKPGFKFGLNIDYFFQENYAFSTSLLINNCGGIVRYTGQNIPFIAGDSVYQFSSGVSVTYKLQYIEIPLSVKLKTNRIGYFTFYGLFGLHPMININAKGDVNQGSITDANISREVNSFNMGYHIGGGLEYEIGNSFAISAGLVFSNGFTDITTNTTGRKNDKTILNSLTLLVAFLF
jgi:hypothetical protein